MSSRFIAAAQNGSRSALSCIKLIDRSITLAACARHGAVYLHAIGGAAVYLAGFVRRVGGVHLLDELGVPEAFWLFEVGGFPAVVTMDASGGSLHASVGARSAENLDSVVKGG